MALWRAGGAHRAMTAKSDGQRHLMSSSSGSGQPAQPLPIFLLRAVCGYWCSIVTLEPYPLPRAVHFDDEIMRVFQTIGVARPCVGNHPRQPVGMRFVDSAGKLLARLAAPRRKSDRRAGMPVTVFISPISKNCCVMRLRSIRMSTFVPGKEVYSVTDCGGHVEVGFTDMGERRKICGQGLICGWL